LSSEQQQEWLGIVAELSPFVEELFPGNPRTQRIYLTLLASEILAGRLERDTARALLEFPPSRPNPIDFPFPEDWLREAKLWLDTLELRWWKIAPITRLFPRETWEKWFQAFWRLAQERGMDLAEQSLRSASRWINEPPINPHDYDDPVKWYMACREHIMKTTLEESK